MRNIRIAAVNICRFILAVTFIFSGYVKAIDPLGTLYKLKDYAAAMALNDILPDWALVIVAIALGALEYSLGVFMLFAVRRHMVSKLTLALMSVMTALTVWIYIADPVKDCGCFGDALKLTNGETLLKNIVLIACATLVAWRPVDMARFISRTNQWIVRYYTITYIVVTSVYCLYTLPIFDFRPYRVGMNIKQGMEIPEGAEQPEFESTFILRKNGVTREFTLDNYPDSTWEYVDTKTVQTKKGYEPPIHDFAITTNDTGEDITEQVLTKKGYTFLLVSPRLAVADDSNFGDIDQIYEYAEENGVDFFCLTASTNEDIERWRELTGAEYTFCNADETTLKTMIRSNPGLILLKDGTIIGKWSHNALPQTDDLTAPLEQLPIGKAQNDSMPERLLIVLLTFFVPLMALTIADRLWAWTKWIRNKQDNNRIFNLFKKRKKMRKKIVAGNWKMNLNLQDGVALAKEINEALVAEKPNCEVIICTPFIHLASVAQVLDQNVVALGAENCADKVKGAYTGEVSAEMVKSTGAQYVILGHSERRQYYHETAEILKEKVDLALANGLKILFCCGETLEERKAEKQNEVVKAELEGSVFHLDAEAWKNIVIAYEPIWAIGTGMTATSDQAEEMLAYIRSIVAEKYGQEAAEDTSILYGGSCKASNAPELFSKPNIDGGLIGGASLKCADFKGIIDAWKK
ncbi:triose-phosphate isomerase [Prevotella stercorea]|uniref:BT_3928 family protein n=1 Tax=Leyella stercorea TaxID=363265 RepID=UPI001C2BB8A9|nr:BT_3928 family protein [Leyella stercorea]MBU9897145.1 triose-phosphate isomerase [Leyella stercorea]MBU9945366.1 triose-phosphate isomerase [Leyella stercorea]